MVELSDHFLDGAGRYLTLDDLVRPHSKELGELFTAARAATSPGGSVNATYLQYLEGSKLRAAGQQNMAMAGIFNGFKDETGADVPGIKAEFEANYDPIMETIESKINAELAGVKDDGSKAAAVIIKYLTQFFEGTPPSQLEADALASRQLSANMYGAQVFGVRGNPQDLYAMRQRTAARKLLKDEKDKDGKVTGYKVSGAELRKVASMKNVALVLSAYMKATAPSEE